MASPAPHPRTLWTLLASGCFALVAGSFALTAWLDLHPCHLCIFQRLLFMVLAVLGVLAAWRGSRPGGRLAGLASLPIAAGGAGVASYQSWLQAQPPGSISCMAAEPGLIERLVEWLGQRMPELFLATGFCEEAELIILGMTLANWALVAFLAGLITAAWALLAARPGRLR
jgi:disulfide bond formation protein DsbB